MNQHLKRTLSLLLVLILVLSLAAPAFAADGTITCKEGKYNVYMGAGTGNVTMATFDIAFGNKNFTIKSSSVKLSPGTTDAKLVNFRKYSNTTKFENHNNSDGTWFEVANYPRCTYTVGITATKMGTCTLSYKVGTTTYKLKLKLIPYSNPTGSITLTGVKSNKSFASMTKNEPNPYSKSLSLPATTKSAKLKVTAANSKWLIKSVAISDQTSGNSRSASFGNGVSSVTLPWGTLNVKHKYLVSVTYGYDGWTMSTFYHINGAKAPA